MEKRNQKPKRRDTNQLERRYENDQIDQVIDAKKNEESERVFWSMCLQGCKCVRAPQVHVVFNSFRVALTECTSSLVLLLLLLLLVLLLLLLFDSKTTDASERDDKSIPQNNHKIIYALV